MSTAAHLFTTEGALLQVGSNQPFWLNEPEQVWFVETGKLDLFVVPLAGSEPAGPRSHFVRVEAGQLLFGLGRNGAGAGVGWVVVGGHETRLYRLPLARLRQVEADAQGARALAGWVDAWIQLLYAGLSGALPPTECEAVQAGEEISVPEATPVRASSGVVWAKQLEGQSLLGGLEELTLAPGDGVAPLSGTGWLLALDRARVGWTDTPSLLERNLLWPNLIAFHDLASKWAAARLMQADREEAVRLEAKADSQRVALKSAVSHLSALLVQRADRRVAGPEGEEPLVRACRLVGRAAGMAIKAPPTAKRGRLAKDPLGNIAKASRIRVRRVVLGGDWWRQDNGPILAYRQEGNAPVALLPSSASSYELVDPATGAHDQLSEERAQTLHPVAYTFYPAFADRALSVWEVFKFGIQGAQKDLAMMVLMSMGGVILGMLVPIVTGIIFDSVIPSAAGPELLFLAAALVVTALVEVIFGLTQGVALLRVEAKSDASIQAAVWDRLLRLPTPFFRNYTAGDLALRANGINAIRQMISGAVITSLLGGLFSFFNLALLCYYSLKLTLVALGLVVLNIGVMVSVTLLILRFQRPLYELQGKISGQVLQFITGIAKLRVAGAESHAYAVWARGFSAQKQLDLRAGKVNIVMTVFNEIYPVFTSICLFSAMAYGMSQGLSTGKFLAFSAAFMTFLHAGIDASSALISLVQAVPIYERTKPILETLPEVTEAKADPGALSGRIEFSHVSFRYKPDGPLILDDVSIQVHAGEFAAIVGPSGSGKSTMMRLLLGFEKPESGTIYYDGLDLAGLDVQALRRQCGVVLQAGKLMPGDIYENIVGSSLLTLEDAWEAARAAGFEEDIRDMPMGMHTVLGEGAGTLSGGQRQRLMIARAIVARPRILLFDEATSALDNRTQAIVSRSLEQLKATRIVIAHRLSTIQHADRTFVLRQGRLVQSGTYSELMAQPGPFAELARRQLI
jgi:ATP-binding cassette subfamily C protein